MELASLMSCCIPVDGEGDYAGDGAVNVQFLLPLGYFQTSYAYYGKDEYDDDMPAGWYDEMEDELAVYSFNAAEGLMVMSSEVCNFQYSGEVNMAFSFSVSVRRTMRRTKSR